MKKYLYGLSIAALLISTYLLSNSYLNFNDYNTDPESYVYEVEVSSKDECSSLESYNIENSTCYFVCSSDEECNKIESEIDRELSSWTEDQAGDNKNKETHKISENESNTSDTLAKYKVNNNEMITLIEGEDLANYKNIWDYVTSISPDNLSNMHVDTFEIFNDTKSDTLAFVDDEESDGKWRIAINLPLYSESTPKEKALTIVHELAHIVTLNNNQLKPSDSCAQYYTDEGCTNANSYLNTFVNNFWTDSDIQKIRDGKKVNYNENKYVTEYASTNAEEDIAESFAYFVMGDKSTETQIKNSKTNHFYNFDELILMRDMMREGVKRDVIRARQK